MPTFEEPDPLNPEGDIELGHVPDWYSRGCQIRQFGVGGASTLGQPPNISTALAFPPATMSIGLAGLRAGVVVVEGSAARYDYGVKEQGVELSPSRHGGVNDTVENPGLVQ